MPRRKARPAPAAIEAASGPLEVRWHGRGGQGVVVASQIAGYAAFLEGHHVQCFPEFGVERRGAPVRAFLRIAPGPIHVRSAVERPRLIVVLDPLLLGQPDTWAGTDGETVLVFNSRGRTWKLPERIGPTYAVDATAIAVRHGIGTATTPIVNTAMAGAFARASGRVSLDAVARAIGKYTAARAEPNVRAAREAFEQAAPPDGRPA